MKKNRITNTRIIKSDEDREVHVRKIAAKKKTEIIGEGTKDERVKETTTN